MLLHGFFWDFPCFSCHFSIIFLGFSRVAPGPQLRHHHLVPVWRPVPGGSLALQPHLRDHRSPGDWGDARGGGTTSWGKGYIRSSVSIHLSINQSIYPRINLSIYQSIYLSINLSSYLSINQSINQPIYLSISLSLSLFRYMHIYIYTYICTYIYIYMEVS